MAPQKNKIKKNYKLVIFLDAGIKRMSEGLGVLCGYTPQIAAMTPYFKEIDIYAPEAKRDLGFLGERHVITDSNVKGFYVNFVKEGRLNFLKNKKKYRSFVRNIIENEDPDRTIFMTYVPGSKYGLVALGQMKEFAKHYFVRVTTNVIEEFRRRGNKLWRKSLTPLIKFPVEYCLKKLLSDVLCFFSGRLLYGDNKNHYKIISASFDEGVIRERNNFKIKPPYKLLYVGRFDKVKGLPYLIEAVSILVRKNIPVTLSIVGFGGGEDQLQELVDKKNLGDKVSILGPVPFGPELFKYYRSADIFVVPSLEDMQPKTPLEAMSQGTPVIGSDITGIRAIIINEKNGILVPPADSKAIAKAVTRLIKDESLRKQLIVNGYKTAMNSTVEKQTKFMIKTLEKELGVSL